MLEIISKNSTNQVWIHKKYGATLFLNWKIRDSSVCVSDIYQFLKSGYNGDK